MPVRSPAPALLTLAAASLAAACAGGAAEQAAPSAAPPSPTPSPTPTVSVPASVACLEEGTWLVDGARQAQLFAEGLDSHAHDVAADVTGEAAHTFADGVLTRTYTGWAEHFSAVLEVEGLPRVEETSTLEGTTTAAYEATATDVVTQEADVAGLVVTVTATKNGEPVSFDDPGANQVAAEREAQSWAYTCEGDTLRLSARGEDGTPAGEQGTLVLHRR